MTQDDLDQLIEKARKIEMTPDQEREQRRSFVYGNTHIENERITRALVAEADELVSESRSKDRSKEDMGS